MAVELIGTDEFGRAQYKGLSTDTKPNAEVGSTLIETDTKNKYEQRATGSAGWVNTDIGGAASVAIASDNTYPELIPDSDSVTLAASGVGAEIKLNRTVPKSGITFTISGLTTETVTIKTYLDEAFTLETAALRPYDANTGALAAASTLGNGSYVLRDVPGYGFHFQKSATTETPTITYVAAS